LADFLEGYGEKDARRERRTRNIIIGVVAFLIVGTALYFMFRNWREERQYKAFIEFLEKKDYNGAYRLWGCDPANPCRDYSMAKFLEDWGPASGHTDIQKVVKAKTLTCGSGIIKVMEFTPADQVTIWIDKKDQIVSFSPWGPSCRQPIVTAPR